MNYSAIKKCDIANGEGIRVVLFVSGCDHYCNGCHNKETWNPDNGKAFTDDTLQEIFKELDKDYISGITISGGDPFYKYNILDIYSLIIEIKEQYPNKSIWIYTGYTLDELLSKNSIFINVILRTIDVLVDGPYIENLKDITYKWAGSTNQQILTKEQIKKIMTRENNTL